MADDRILQPSRALRSVRVRRGLLWLTLIVALILGVLAAAPPTRTEALPWTGTLGA
jgi:hypothetical protein